MNSVIEKTPTNGANAPANGAIVANGIDTSTEAFKEQVEKSKLNIQAVETPPKRRVGRPKGSFKKVSGHPTPDRSSVTTQSSMTGPAPAPDISQYLIHPIMALSKIPAGAYDIPELALTAEEAGLCAHSCNQLLQVFAPTLGEMSPKTAAVIGALSVFGSIGFSKYQIFIEKMRLKRPKPAAPTVKTEETVPQPSGGPVSIVRQVDAAEFFQRS